MKKTIVSLMLLVASTSFAKTYKCVFTEPFFNVTYKTGINVLITKNFDERARLNFDIEGQSYNEGKNIMVLDSDNAHVILSMKKTGEGTDGMSDKVYEYEAVYTANDHSPSYHGGCDLK